MTYRVRFTRAASRDINEISAWIAEHDSPAKADYVLGRLFESTVTLRSFPLRGSRPHELPPGVEIEFRQIFFKPYRIIYEVAHGEVVIHAVLDGRRNLQSLLMRRLLENR